MQSGTMPISSLLELHEFKNFILSPPSTVSEVWDNNPQLQSWLQGETADDQALSDNDLLNYFRFILDTIQRYSDYAGIYICIMQVMWGGNTRLHAAVENNKDAKLILEEMLQACIILRYPMAIFLESIKNRDLIKSLVSDIKDDTIKLKNSQIRQFNEYSKERGASSDELIPLRPVKRIKTSHTVSDDKKNAFCFRLVSSFFKHNNEPDKTGGSYYLFSDGVSVKENTSTLAQFADFARYFDKPRK